VLDRWYSFAGAAALSRWHVQAKGSAPAVRVVIDVLVSTDGGATWASIFPEGSNNKIVLPAGQPGAAGAPKNLPGGLLARRQPGGVLRQKLHAGGFPDRVRPHNHAPAWLWAASKHLARSHTGGSGGGQPTVSGSASESAVAVARC